MHGTAEILFCIQVFQTQEFLFLWPEGLQMAVYVCVSHSVVSNSETPWTVAQQAPLSMEFSSQEYWSG